MWLWVTWRRCLRKEQFLVGIRVTVLRHKARLPWRWQPASNLPLECLPMLPYSWLPPAAISVGKIPPGKEKHLKFSGIAFTWKSTYYNQWMRIKMLYLRFSRRWLWRMTSSRMLRHVILVRTDVSEERFASIIRVTRIDELGTTLAVASNRRTLRRNTKWERKLVWNTRLRMQRGVGVAGRSVGL
jgi:hypothetical protein